MMSRYLACGGLRATALLACGVATMTVAPLRAQEHQMHEHSPEPVLSSKHHKSFGAPAQSGTLVENGVRVSFDLTPMSDTAAREIRSDQSVQLSMKLRDEATGEPLSGLMIGAWLDMRQQDSATTAKACTERITSYLQQRLAARPVVDLNSYFLLALNRGNNISVIDPFLGFGSSNLYTTVQLPGAGADWALDPRGTRLYVSIPQQNLVVAVDPATWRVAERLDVAARPIRLAFQPDGEMLWVATDFGDSSGVAAIDPATRTVVARITTGHGHHELAFSADSRFLAVSNQADSNLTIISTSGMHRTADVALEGVPTDIAYSPVGKALYAVTSNGTINIVDFASHAVRDRLRGAPGLQSIQFDPSGRWGFALNGKINETFVLDATVDSIRHAFHMTGSPDQVAFTHSFAYVRSSDTSDVMMIPLKDLQPGHHASSFAEDYSSGGTSSSGPDGVVAVSFQAGALKPDEFGAPGWAQAISPAPEHGSHGDAVYIPNPAEKAIYYYHYMEGMPTPSGSIDNYGFEPLATMTVGRHLEETAPGVYDAAVRLPSSGRYDIVFVLDEPRVVHCFPFSVKDNPAIASTEPVELKVEGVLDPALVPGKQTTVRFRLRDWKHDAVHAGFDVKVKVMSTSGWSQRYDATAAADSTYEVSVTVPKSGVYYLSVAVPDLNLGFRDQEPLVLRTSNLVSRPRASESRRQ